jgi:hypothetical protein
MDIISAALDYISKGWWVLPIHGMRNGACTCNSTCDRPGKHPAWRAGVHGATQDRAMVTRWFTRHPNHNLAVATGQSGLVALDVDLNGGGAEGLRQLLARHPEVKPGRKARSGSGFHYFYKGDYPSSVRDLGPGLDTRGRDGYIIVAPSVHANGTVYEWLDAIELPEWPLKQESFDTQEPCRRIESGSRNDSLFSFAGTLRARGLEERTIRDCLAIINRDLCTEPLGEPEIAELARKAAKLPPHGRRYAQTNTPDWLKNEYKPRPSN